MGTPKKVHLILGTTHIATGTPGEHLPMNSVIGGVPTLHSPNWTTCLAWSSLVLDSRVGLGFRVVQSRKYGLAATLRVKSACID